MKARPGKVTSQRFCSHYRRSHWDIGSSRRLSKILSWLESAASANIQIPSCHTVLSQVWESPGGPGTQCEGNKDGDKAWWDLGSHLYSWLWEACPGPAKGRVVRWAGELVCLTVLNLAGDFWLVPKPGVCWCFSSLVSLRGGEAAPLSGSWGLRHRRQVYKYPLPSRSPDPSWLAVISGFLLEPLHLQPQGGSAAEARRGEARSAELSFQGLFPSSLRHCQAVKSGMGENNIFP